MRQLGFDYLEPVFTGDSADDIYVISSPVQSVRVVDEDARLLPSSSYRPVIRVILKDPLINYIISLAYRQVRNQGTSLKACLLPGKSL